MHWTCSDSCTHVMLDLLECHAIILCSIIVYKAMRFSYRYFSALNGPPLTKCLRCYVQRRWLSTLSMLADTIPWKWVCLMWSSLYLAGNVNRTVLYMLYIWLCGSKPLWGRGQSMLPPVLPLSPVYSEPRPSFWLCNTYLIYQNLVYPQGSDFMECVLQGLFD